MVALYVRVSTEDQRKYGISVDDQIRDLVSYCDANGIEEYKIYNDAGMSGRKKYTSRPALMQLLSDVDSGDINLILFTKMDRFTRSTRDFYEIAQRLSDAGCAWRTTREQHETETADGRFKTGLFMLLAEEEADRCSERIKRVMDYKLAQGEWRGGIPPTGYKQVGKRLEYDPATYPGMRALFDTYLKTRSRKMAIEAAAENGVVIQADFFHKCVKKEIYTGTLHGADMAPAYITKDQHDLICEYSVATPKTSTHIYLFSSLCKCGKCGGCMRVNMGNRSISYTCSNHKKFHTCEGIYISERKIERAMLEQLQPVIDAARNAQYDMADKKDDSKKIKALLQRKDRLKDLYISGDISRTEYNDRKAAFDRELEKIQPKKEPVPELPAGWRDIYDSLDQEHRALFWHSIVKKIVVHSDKDIELHII